MGPGHLQERNGVRKVLLRGAGGPAGWSNSVSLRSWAVAGEYAGLAAGDRLMPTPRRQAALAVGVA